MMKAAATSAAVVVGMAIMATIAGTGRAGRTSGAIGSKSFEKGGTGAGAASPLVVVELFTSEGCSSCPSADAVLMRLEKQSGSSGSVPIIALEQHVDYWNRLGWADPFSSKPFSDRQYDYARVFQTEGVYTPQMVVDGQAEFVGSDEARANAAIANAARRPKASVSLSVQPGAAGGTKVVRVVIGVLPGGVRTGEVFAALTESGLSSQVARGENAGRHLVHASIVRQLVSIGTVGPQGGMLTQKIIMPASVRKENVRTVLFVQDKATRRIVGAAQAALIQATL